MDKTDGRGSPARTTIDFSPDAPDKVSLGDRAEAYGLGAPFRRLEADMGLPSGYLAIHEHSSQQSHWKERPNSAPYYQAEENRQNPRPGTIPIRVQESRQNYIDRRYTEQPCDPCTVQRNQQQNYDQSQGQYIDQRGRQYYDQRQQQYYDQRQQQQYYEQQGQYVDPRARQYYEQRQQQYYYDQRQGQNCDPCQTQNYNQSQFIDDRFQRGNVYQQQWWNQTQYPNVQQRNEYQQRWYEQSQYPSGPNRNGYQEQWWDQSQVPSDQRFIPGRNPQLNQYRQEWWNQAQTPPNEYQRRAPQQPVQIDRNRQPYPQQVPVDRVPYQQQVPVDRVPYQQQPAEQALDPRFGLALQSFLGHSVQEYDRTVPNRLGCARAVSLALEKAYGLPIRDQGCENLEEDIKRNGWVAVDPRTMQAGDVIIAYREPGDYGHAAIYVGNGQIYNNNSNTEKIQVESVSKFQSAEFKKINVYRKRR
jgi:hypothetical protein